MAQEPEPSQRLAKLWGAGTLFVVWVGVSGWQLWRGRTDGF